MPPWAKLYRAGVVRTVSLKPVGPYQVIRMSCGSPNRIEVRALIGAPRPCGGRAPTAATAPYGPTAAWLVRAIGTGSDFLSVVMHPPPRPASNTNAAAVRFIRTYSGRCALVGRRRALGPRGRGMSKLRVI